ncbi:MAG: hypothetical protein K6A77_12455 [Clostridiales bacterium]|nr:hypothetical protein [Clostridiales bacterium]
MMAICSMFLDRIRTWCEDQDGFGTLELVLLVCVLIALALLFKNTIVSFVSNMLKTISTQGSGFDPASLAK